MEKRFSVNLRHRLLLLVSAKCLRALLAAFDGPWKLKFQRNAGWAASSRFLMASLRYRVCHVGQLLPGLGDDEAVLAGDVVLDPVAEWAMLKMVNILINISGEPG